MAFQKKTWIDRLAEFPGRRLLKIISQSATEIVADVFRNEGDVSREGDPYSATNMNDLEQRIGDEFTQLYSDIQILRNDLSALDTRVTNAITGGDLVPPYTLDLSALSYKDEIHGQNSSVTQSRMAVAADSQNGTGYVIRRFSTTFTVPKKGKIKINLSRYNKDSYTTGIPITVHVYALDPSSSHESNNLLSKSIKIDGEDSLDLSSLAGRNIKVTLGMTRSGGTIYNTCGITINSLIVTNQ